MTAVVGIAGGYLLANGPGSGTLPESVVESEPAARVGESVLAREELLLTGGGPAEVEAWVEDELLAQLAVERGLEDPLASAFVQKRARQLYLRDLIVDQTIAGIAPPTRAEMLDLIRSDSLLYSVERHYFEILVPDSAMAESLLERLDSGQSFQVMAENISLGQKAALGGDLGFLAGGELTGRGIPQEIGLLEGLSGLVRSEYGWHIFLVTETRELTDTARVASSLSSVVLARRQREAVDRLIEEARAGRTVDTGHGQGG